MIVPPHKWQTLYESLRKDGQESSGTTTIIGVGASTDALAAARLLSTALASDHVQFLIVPLLEVSDVEDMVEEYLSPESPGVKDLRSLVFINVCGGLDLLEMLPLQEDWAAHLLVYVWDCHRPLHVNNVYDQQSIICVDDGRLDMSLVPSMTAPLEELAQYYEKTSFAAPTSFIMHDCLERAAKGGQASGAANLWLAIVGLTDSYLHGRTTEDEYGVMYRVFAEHVRVGEEEEDDDDGEHGLGGNGGRSDLRSFMQRVPEDDGVDDDDDGMAPVSQARRRLTAGVASLSERLEKDEERIVCASEMKLLLLRHWSVYESMYHSPFVASALNVWRQKGHEALLRLLAMVGISLVSAKQPYSMMPFRDKHALIPGLLEHGPALGLRELRFDSFYKKHGFQVEMSAADVALAVTALLEEPYHEEEEMADEKLKELRELNFWRAYDATSPNQSRIPRGMDSLLRTGVDAAINLQKAIVREASTLSQTNAIVIARTFHYAFLAETADLVYFARPLALRKLALLLIEQQPRTGSRKPLVLAARNHASNSFLVVGVTSPDGGANNFGSMFEQAANKTNAALRHQYFDSTVIEMQRESISKFMQYLMSLAETPELHSPVRKRARV